MDLREIAAAYEAVYVAEEKVTEDLSLEELETIAEEVVDSLLEEGLSVEEIEEISEELTDNILTEATVTMGHDSYGPQSASPKEKKDVDSAQRKAKAEARKAAVVKGIKSGVEKAKSAPGKALRAVAKGTEKVETEVGRRASNVATRAKAGATRAAMKATGVKAIDVPKKDGTARKSADTFVAGRKSDRDSAKKLVKDKVVSKVKSAKDAIKSAPGKVADAVKGAASAVKKGARRVAGRAAYKGGTALLGLAKRLKEEGGELDSFDTVVAYLIDEEIASTFEEATAKMSKLSAETISEIHESQLQLLDEAVYGGGKKEEKKDTRMTVTNADKKANTPAYQNYMKGDKRYKAADHMKGDK
jgi:hypothetical protein